MPSHNDSTQQDDMDIETIRNEEEGDERVKKRGTRGGKRHNKAKKRERAELMDATSVPQPSSSPSISADIKESKAGGKRKHQPDNDGEEGKPKDDGVPDEQKKKKTRRGKRGANNKTTADSTTKSREEEREVSSGHLEGEFQPPEFNPEELYPGTPPSPYGYLPDDVRSYFRNIENILDSQNATIRNSNASADTDPSTAAFESAEEQANFVSNVFKELDGKEILLAVEPETSRILEKLLGLASDFQVRVFCDRLQGHYADLFQHQFASHVIQTVLGLAYPIIEREISAATSANENNKSKDLEENSSPKDVKDKDDPSEDQAASLPTMLEAVLAIIEQLQELWFPLITNPYASHLVRSLICMLTGEVSGGAQEAVRSKKSKKYSKAHQIQSNSMAKVDSRSTVIDKASLPKEFSTALSSIMNALSVHLNTEALRTLCVHPVANPVLQLLLNHPTTDTSDKGGSLVDRIVGDFKDPDHQAFFRDLMEHTVGSHIVEKLFPHLNPVQFMLLYRTYFHDQLAALCDHPRANFVVQKLIANLQHESQLSIMLVEIGPILARLLFSNRTGVVIHILEACVRLKATTCQAKATALLLQAYQIKAPGALSGGREDEGELKDLTRYIITHSTPTTFRTHLTASVQGSLVAQQLLQFESAHSQLLGDSLIASSVDNLHGWCMDPMISRVLEGMLKSPTISLPSKRKLILSLTGHWVTLAKDKFGSHVIDACWAVADVQCKERIVQEFVSGGADLSSDFYGRFVMRNCRVDLYKRRRVEWIQRETNVVKRKDMFKDIVGDGNAPAPTSNVEGPGSGEWTPKFMKGKQGEKGASDCVIDQLFLCAEGSRNKSTRRQ